MSITSPLSSRIGIVALVLLAALAAPAFGTLINAFVFPQPPAAENTVTGNDAFFFTPLRSTSAHDVDDTIWRGKGCSS